MASPGLSEFRFHPLRSRSRGLSNSTAQFAVFPPLVTFIRTWTCGLTQSTRVTCPFSVTGFVGSNFPEISWCASIGVQTIIDDSKTSRPCKSCRGTLFPPDKLVASRPEDIASFHRQRNGVNRFVTCLMVVRLEEFCPLRADRHHRPRWYGSRVQSAGYQTRPVCGSEVPA